jgi:hypothetical protein
MSRGPGSITTMKRQLELETLEERRHSVRLILKYKVVEGLVPALPTADIVTTAKPNRNNKAKAYKDCETTNIIERRLIMNSKGLKVPDCNKEQSKHSFFVETIVHWNQQYNYQVKKDKQYNYQVKKQTKQKPKKKGQKKQKPKKKGQKKK